MQPRRLRDCARARLKYRTALIIGAVVLFGTVALASHGGGGLSDSRPPVKTTPAEPAATPEQNDVLATFQDDFNDNSFDTATRWDVIDTRPFERNGRLECPAAAGISYYGVRSKSTYDLTGSHFFVEIVAPPFSYTDAEFQIQVGPATGGGSETHYSWYKAGSNDHLQARKDVAGVFTKIGANITYNNTMHRFLRIRESGGTIFWDASPDGTTWANQRSTAAGGFALTAVKVFLGSGNYAQLARRNTSIIDNANVVGASV
jgi:hypothetical protein